MIVRYKLVLASDVSNFIIDDEPTYLVSASDMSLPLALQPQANPDKDEKSLQHLIARINEERGSFRDVDEAKLKEEIARDLATDVEAQGNENEDVEEPQDAESRRKEVYTARNEMLKLIGYARNDNVVRMAS